MEKSELAKTALREIPLHQFLGLEVESSEAGRSVLRMRANERTINAGGIVHGGVLYTALDAASYMAILPALGPDENAVTHDLHVSVYRPASVDQDLEFRGRLVRKGRTVAFGEAEAWAGGKLVASARVTKSIVSWSHGLPQPGRG